MSASTRDARVRIGDAERDAAVTALGEHFAAGRLTRDEFDERLEQAWAAKTGADIDPLFADLPGDRSPARATPAQPVGFHDRGRRAVEPRRGRGAPPELFMLLAVAIMVTILTHLPFVLMVLGVLFIANMIKNRGAARRGHWAQCR